MSDAARGIAYPLYERVERERVLRGWSSTKLHQETGVSRSTIAKWRTQQRPPQPATVFVVADRLGIDRTEALSLAGILTDISQAGPDVPDTPARQAILTRPGLTERDRKIALAVYDALSAAAEARQDQDSA
jgi:transcriptional regulator with XRE-family HTH domain